MKVVGNLFSRRDNFSKVGDGATSGVGFAVKNGDRLRTSGGHRQ